MAKLKPLKDSSSKLITLPSPPCRWFKKKIYIKPQYKCAKSKKVVISNAE